MNLFFFAGVEQILSLTVFFQFKTVDTSMSSYCVNVYLFEAMHMDGFEKVYLKFITSKKACGIAVLIGFRPFAFYFYHNISLGRIVSFDGGGMLLGWVISLLSMHSKSVKVLAAILFGGLY